MKIGIIGEGDTKYYCIPSLVAKLNHTVVGVRNLGGVGEKYDWQALFECRIYPYVRSFAKSANLPDKVIIVLDRERRQDCCGSLAIKAVEILNKKLVKERLHLPISVILANRQIECWLFSMPEILDRSPRFKRPISSLIGDSCDGKDILEIVRANLRSGKGWDKIRDGRALAQKINPSDPHAVRRSRSLRKFVKELS